MTNDAGMNSDNVFEEDIDLVLSSLRLPKIPTIETHKMK